jgi:hypothetical protein
MVERRTCHAAEMQPVRRAAVILAPGHFVGVLVEVFAADPMMDAHLGAGQTAEPAFRRVRASPVIGLELTGVIDPQHRIGRMQRVPGARLVGIRETRR